MLRGSLIPCLLFIVGPAPESCGSEGRWTLMRHASTHHGFAESHAHAAASAFDPVSLLPHGAPPRSRPSTQLQTCPQSPAAAVQQPHATCSIIAPVLSESLLRPNFIAFL